MQQQNALIGANIALYYPDVSLTGVFGYTGRGGLAIAFANEFSRLAATATQTIFNAGLISAQVEAAIAAYDQSVATYRQTVLTAFQQVEDQLAAVRILARQQKVADEAVKASQEELDILLNQYRAGTVAFTADRRRARNLACQRTVGADGKTESLSCRRRAHRGAWRRMG